VFHLSHFLAKPGAKSEAGSPLPISAAHHYSPFIVLESLGDFRTFWGKELGNIWTFRTISDSGVDESPQLNCSATGCSIREIMRVADKWNTRQVRE
jgi:hypothetical protein